MADSFVVRVVRLPWPSRFRKGAKGDILTVAPLSLAGEGGASFVLVSQSSCGQFFTYGIASPWNDSDYGAKFLRSPLSRQPRS